MAVSHWRVEAERATRKSVAFNFNKALKQWDTNLMAWPNGIRRQMAFWTWRREYDSEPMHAALPMRTEDFPYFLIKGVPEPLR